MTGKTVSHYEILERIGEGGMGVVYKARDTRLDRLVVLKVLPADKVTNPERKRRFFQEAKAASALNHPNIVHLYDIIEEGGIDFMAMEYVSGKTLDELIPRGGMRLNDALKYGIQIAGALTAAHDAFSRIFVGARGRESVQIIVNHSGAGWIGWWRNIRLPKTRDS